MAIEITYNVEHSRPSWPRNEAPELWHRAEGIGIPGSLYFRVARGADGRWYCSDIDIEGNGPITTTALRRIPLTGILELFLRRKVGWEAQGGILNEATGMRDFYDVLPGAPSVTGEALLDSYSPSLESALSQPQRGGPPPSEARLKDFANAYEYALEIAPRSPIREAIDSLSSARGYTLSRSTAYNYLRRAREAGLLQGEHS